MAKTKKADMMDARTENPDGSVSWNMPVANEAGETVGRDVSADLAPWVCSGTAGQLVAMRAGLNTAVSGGLSAIAGNVAGFIAGGATDEEVRAVLDGNGTMDGKHEVRVMNREYLPPPASVVALLTPLNQWPSILYAPVPAEVGIGYATNPAGRHVIVTVARRNVITRAPRKPKGT